MSNLQFQNDLDRLMEVVPDKVKRHVNYEQMEDVIEIVLDIGRVPEIRHSSGKIEYLGTDIVNYDDIKYITDRIQNFTSDNRSGIPGTLHRISAIRNRQGKIVGLTCRIGRVVTGTIACIKDFAENCENVKNVVCLNDPFAIIMRNCYPELLQNKRVCSCSGMKISEYMESPYPTGITSYYKAGVQIAELYLFLMRLDEICSTALTLEMDIVPGKRYSGDFPLIDSSYSQSGVDFYGDKTVAEVERLNQTLLMLDEIDEQILHDIMAGDSYETIADNRHLALNTVKYRVHAMVKNADVSGRKDLMALIEKYNLII